MIYVVTILNMEAKSYVMNWKANTITILISTKTLTFQIERHQTSFAKTKNRCARSHSLVKYSVKWNKKKSSIKQFKIFFTNCKHFIINAISITWWGEYEKLESDLTPGGKYALQLTVSWRYLLLWRFLICIYLFNILLTWTVS